MNLPFSLHPAALIVAICAIAIVLFFAFGRKIVGAENNGETVNLVVGNDAPEFTLPNAQGKMISLDQFKGKKVVIYFYPKDNTPGCTIENKNFSALMEDFAKQNTVLLGISRDTAESHAKFESGSELKVELLSDVDGSVSRKYGVIKGVLGEFGVISRTTFVVNEKGVIIKVYNDVNVIGHAANVLDFVSSHEAALKA